MLTYGYEPPVTEASKPSKQICSVFLYVFSNILRVDKHSATDVLDMWTIARGSSPADVAKIA
jgi:hypothetical protein